MGYDIFVAGSGGLQYSRRDRIYGDEWDLNAIQSQILTRGSQRLIGVGISDRSMTGSAVRRTMNAESRIMQAHLLDSAIALVMANHGDGIINLRVRNTHQIAGLQYWPDTGEFVRIEVAGDSSSDVTLDVLRCLHRNGMNRWGPIIDILEVLTLFDAQFTGFGGYMINIEISG